MKILFLLKSSYNYGDSYETTSKSGLLNSATITAAELKRVYGVKTKIDICIDGNEVDKYVTAYEPEVCILEAIWVTPAKMAELINLHPDTKFIIRIHSEIPFLSNEGNAVDWIMQYFELDMHVAFNSSEATIDFLTATEGQPIYLPNIYHHIETRCNYRIFKGIKVTPLRLGSSVPKHLHIGCFGAIRPMKNQLLQAFAAIKMAKKHGRKLTFHINSGRVEQGGDSSILNIRALFKKTPYELVEHDWEERDGFLKLIGHMDAGMQVSYNESFNLVTADFVMKEVPIVVSDAIKWMPNELQVIPTEAGRIASTLWNSLVFSDYYSSISKSNLAHYNSKALADWGMALQDL